MKEHDINKLDTFICGYYLSNLELCDEIVEYHAKSNKKEEGKIVVDGELCVKKDKKDSIDVSLNDHHDLRVRYGMELQKCLNLYTSKYPKCNVYSTYGDLEPINVQHYVPGGGYFEWHTERNSPHPPSNNRHLAFMTYLNDVTDDGETEFYHQKLKIKPEKGLTLIWGCDWTFTHRGVTSPTQDKFIVTGWLSYYDIKNLTIC